MNLGRARDLAEGALANLELHVRRINALNVYPVPDGDTGTNLVHTLRGIVAAVQGSTAATAAELAGEIRRAALMEAKGNSGVIFSQVVRGLGEELAACETVDGPALARALRAGSTRAYEGVERPVEGTMLTAIREMAEEAETPQVSSLPVADALEAVLARGDDAVRRTPEQLAVLAEAGVVDAGAAGLVEIFRGVHARLVGAPLPAAPADLDELSDEAIHREQSRYRYCTVFLVEGESLDRHALQRGLEAVGDSLLVVGDERLVKVHLHTDSPYEALAIGRAAGVVDEDRAEIADMREQASQREDWLTRLRRVTQAPPVATALVAVVAGPGNREIYEREGATFVIEGGQTMNPSVGEIHEAITAVNSEHVIVLPNNPNVHMAAAEAAAMSTRDVRVIGTRSITEGVAAVVVFDPNADIDANEAALRAALSGVVTAEVTVGSRDTVVDGVRVERGSWLGLVAERAVASDADLWTVVDVVLDRLTADGRSLVTVLTGEDAPPVVEVRESIERRHPGLELDVLAGGQPHYPLLLSAE